MKRLVFLLAAIAPFISQAQQKSKDRKYPSLLWEISGKGLKKPSYLFGTMHVSNKLAFQLADSFYLGIRNSDVVALETNPESWQEDMSKYDTEEGGYNSYRYRGSFVSIPGDYLSINTLKFYKYDKKIEQSLYSNPSTINNLLYRTYGNAASDFEEDTYLDMYIYQCGKKWGKKVAGVERYGESMKLMAEAYKDAAKDKNRKERSYDREQAYSPEKIQEAYRTGNLDLLDSINVYNSFSDAFDEKFLYKRNEIQAVSIDSILKTNLSLFVGVGAAHLPGKRGVIEMLRDMGYRLRPIKMGERDSQHKSSVEKIRVPVRFTTQSTDDGFFTVDIPGKFYKFGDDASLDQRQYADMANGSYYMVTRIMTNSWMWGHSTDDVFKAVDSLLYENIPGKILSKSKISKNGYQGFAITNKTRRGDIQRYNIFITPFEILFFKMSGTGDYVANGDEADRFFNSIRFKEYQPATTWKKFTPPHGGFAIELPHEPFTGNDGSWIFDAEDKTAQAQYRVIRTDIHNYGFVEEDTFDLGLMQESFAASGFIATTLSRKQTKYRGYPALDCKFRATDKSIYLVRFVIQGPHYYSLIAHGRQETPRMQAFLNSFEIQPVTYAAAQERRDTSLYFSVSSPVFPDAGKEKLDVPRSNYYGYPDDEESEADLLEHGAFRSKVIANDTTGEKIYVSFFKTQRYYQAKDSLMLEDQSTIWGDSTYIIRMKKRYELPLNLRVWESIVSDTGSSRALWTKTYYRNGIGYNLLTQIDTLGTPSAFIRSFFDTFNPSDTLRGGDPFAKKSQVFFEDFKSSDSVAHRRAVKGVTMIRFDSTDFASLREIITALNWKEKKYLDTKKQLIGRLADIKSPQASNFLKDVYYAAGDTIDLQYAALGALLEQKTNYSFSIFRDIINEEPPVLGIDTENDRYGRSPLFPGSIGPYYRPNGNFLDGLHDSLALSKTILPAILPLLNIDDYEQPLMRLLGHMVDSGLVKPADYQAYLTKFLIEAKQSLKKQAIHEKNKAIQKAARDNEANDNTYRDDEEEEGDGNEKLSLYAKLLLPHMEANNAVSPIMQQMLSSNDKKLKYGTMLLLLKNGKSIPDSLAIYFAGLDDYRYTLYTDLKKLKQAAKFPQRYNNHIDLGKSKLFAERSYNKPDSVVYIDRLPAEIKGSQGYVYFYKYKTKKDDLGWKLATVGLIPQDPLSFEFEKTSRPDPASYYAMYGYRGSEYYKLDVTEFSDTKIEDDEPLKQQMAVLLKKLLYSKRASAREFYARDFRNDYDIATVPGYDY